MVLIFNSTLDNLYLGLANNKRQLISTSKINLLRKFSQKMIPELKKFLEQNNATIDDISTIYFSNGPGSFTSTRLGLVLVKTIAVLQPIKILTIDSLSSLTSFNAIGTFSIRASNHLFYTGVFKDGKLAKPIHITKNNQSTLKSDYNIIKNMWEKKDTAIKWNSFEDVTIDYIKNL